MEHQMTEKNTVILVGSSNTASNQQQKLMNAINQSGFKTIDTTFQDLASALKQAHAHDILIFNLEGLSEETGFLKCNKLAETIKNNPATSTIKILSIGISNSICDQTKEIFNHSFNDLLFGPIRVPSIISRLKSLVRLDTMDKELNRRSAINEQYGLTQKYNRSSFISHENSTLLVTGRPNGFSRIEETLSPIATLVGALSTQAAFDYLERDKFDILIINGGRNPARYLEFIETVRMNTDLYSLPILLVAHPSKLSDSHIPYEAGVTDFIEAPLNKNELVLRTKALIQEHRFRDTLAKTYLEARHIPTNDALTGLYTYSYFREHLDYLLEEYLPLSNKFSLISISIENIEEINRDYGFASGDQVLRQVSEILMTINRGEDLLSRISGRKFVLTLPNTNQKQAINVVQRVEGILKQTKFICESDCSPMTVNLNAEITEYNGEQSADEFLKKHNEQKDKSSNQVKEEDAA
ncbi:MAG: PleD family two-component system response regulator [Methyloligella sp.]|nr:MAG: PleD family two-component system response regulator [Methyloligella sp.]